MNYHAIRRTIEGVRFLTCEAPSLVGLLDWLADGIQAGTIRGSSQNRNTHYGEDSYADAEKLARQGWPEGLARVSKFAENISGIVGKFVKKVEPTYDMAGAMVDVGRFCGGEPECMVEFDEILQQGPGRIVRITVDIGMAGMMDHETIFRRGAAVAALVDGLEQAGLVAEVFLAVSNGLKYHHKGQSAFYFLVPVKRAGEPLEMDRLAYALCHPGMYRRHVFAWQEAQEPAIRAQMGVPGSYGSSSYDYPMSLVEEGEILAPSLGFNPAPFMSDKLAIAWVLDRLREHGCLVEGA